VGNKWTDTPSELVITAEFYLEGTFFESRYNYRTTLLNMSGPPDFKFISFINSYSIWCYVTYTVAKFSPTEEHENQKESSLQIWYTTTSENHWVRINFISCNPICSNSVIMCSYWPFASTNYLLPTSLNTAVFNEIPCRSALLSRKETSEYLSLFLEIHLVTLHICSGRVGWILYTSLSDTSKSPSSVPFERCATRNSQSNGM
jgi:hypothetical protein